MKQSTIHTFGAEKLRKATGRLLLTALFLFAFLGSARAEETPSDFKPLSRVACSAEVENLAVDDISTNGATLTWTATVEDTQWHVAYSTNANFEGAAEEIVSKFSYEITGLLPATHYYAKVRAYCGGEDYGLWSEVLQFNTDCAVIDLSKVKFVENFDNYTVDSQFSTSARTLPVCWSFINTSTNGSYKVYPSIYNYSNYSNTTPNCLILRSYCSSFNPVFDPQPQYAILPPMKNLAGEQITLWARGYLNSSTFKIGMMTDPTDASTFEEIAEQSFTSDNYSTYQEFEYTIPANTKANYIAIMIDAATSARTNNTVYIDDITIGNPPTCPRPTDLAVTDITTTTTTLGWTNGSADQDTWQICLNGDEENLIIASSNPFTITGLTVATSYTAKVRAYCSADDQSKWSDEVSFTTDCVAITALPWNEDFESFTADRLPDCWDNSASTSSTLRKKPQHIWGVYSRNENKMLCMHNFMVNSGTALINSPVIELPAEGVCQLTFDYAHYADCGDFKVNISEDNRKTFTTLASYSNASGSFQSDYGTFTEAEPILLKGYAGKSVILQFSANANYSKGAIFVDNILIDVAPSCVRPTALRASNFTANSADLSWTANGSETEWTIYYKKSADTDYTAVSGVTDNPYTLEDLESGTAYEFYVVANCSAEDTSDASKTYSFTTKYVPLTITAQSPYTQDFEGPVVPSVYNSTTGLVVPAGWENPYTTGPNVFGQPHLVTTGGQYNYGNGQVLCFTGSGNNYITLPKFTNAFSKLQVSFKWATQNSSNGTLTLGYITDEDNGTYNTFTEIQSFAASSFSDSQLKQETVDLSNVPVEATCLAFRWYYNHMKYCNVDDLAVFINANITLEDNGTDNGTKIAENDGAIANVTLSGRTLWTDGYWNTLCLPFDLALEGSPFEDATVKELVGTTSNLTDGTLTLNFTDAASIEAGKPYIVKWGQPVDLVINSADDWNAFAQSVNSGTTYAGKLVKLGKDISISTMVGTTNEANASEKMFCGIFDGNGHTLTVNISGGDAYCVAPFYAIGGATIKNLKVKGTVHGGMHCAGLVGKAGNYTTNRIQNCEVATDVVCDGTPHTHCGGILGHGCQSTTTISNCLFSGSIKGAGTATGIIYGWGDAPGKHTIANCLSAGTYTDCNGIDLLKKDGGTGSISKCYRKTADGTQGTDASNMSNDDLLDGLGNQWMESNGNVVPKRPSLDNNIVNPVFTGVTVVGGSPAGKAVAFTGGKFTGTYNYQRFKSKNTSILLLGGDNTLYYPQPGKDPDTGNAKYPAIGACRAYFQLTDPSATVRAFQLNFGDDSEQTAIVDAEANASPFTRPSSHREGWYDLSGRKIEDRKSVNRQLPKGLYIHNGRKVVIK